MNLSRDVRSTSAPQEANKQDLATLLRNRFHGTRNNVTTEGISRSLASSRTSSSFEWPTLSLDEERYQLQPIESNHIAFENKFSGWLWMKGSRIGRWRHRYFVLNGSMLTYFVAFPLEEFLMNQNAPQVSVLKETTQPRGVIRVAHVRESDCRIGFKIFGTCGKLLDVRAPNHETRNEWLLRLKPSCRRKSLSWSSGSLDETKWSLSSFDSEGKLQLERVSIAITKSGWVWKQSNVFRRWNYYYFVVQGNTLSYYATDKPYQVPRQRVYVEGVTVPRAQKDSCILFVRVGNNQKDLTLRFESESELAEWREVLLDCSVSRK